MGKSNMQKMREALEAAHEFVYALCRQNIDLMVKNKHGERVVKSKDVLYKIYSALSAPPRNCDVGTADEQNERFKCFCKNHQYVSSDSEEGFPPIYVCSDKSCPLHEYYIEHGEDSCELAWAQTPYAEEEGVGK